MALWAKVQQLQGDFMRQLQQTLYGSQFPVEVRHFFAAWIESQPWNEIDEYSDEHEAFARAKCEELIKMTEEKALELNGPEMFLAKFNLNEAAHYFKDYYFRCPMNLVKVVKNCLATEHRYVADAERGISDQHQANKHKLLLQQFEYLHTRTQETNTELRQLQQKQESFVIQYNEGRKIDSQLQLLANQPNGQTRLESEQKLKNQKEALNHQLSEKVEELLQLRLKLADKHNETFKHLSALQAHVLDEQLINWKRQQQLAGNGAPFEGSLDLLQTWCESLAELIWQNRQQIREVEQLRAQIPINTPLGRQDLVPVLRDTITRLLSSLVTNTFIIEKQPPQVLKKDARFAATIRLLVGGKLNVHMNPPTVHASIVSEEQARNLLRNAGGVVRNETSGDILNNTGTMEYHQSNGQLSVTFRNMQLKRIRRAEKKGNETVTEEKFSIVFRSEFFVGGQELQFQVFTLSLPGVVTVHGNQECNALATVLWDNAFAEPGRIPFQVPEKVQWHQLAHVLNTRFMSFCGQGLAAENKAYLATKIFASHSPAEDYSNMPVSWSQFNREVVAGRIFTFWEWFYAILKLTKDWLLGPWKERLIMGFVSRQQATDWLMKRPNGTFLLRFSDSESGGITIAWVAEDPSKPGERQVWNLAPFTDKDFRIRSLGDRIKDLENLLYLYPDIPKARAFSKFWTQTPDCGVVPGVGGYVTPALTTVIPSLARASTAFDDPRTPLLMEPQSPASEACCGHVHSHQIPITEIQRDMMSSIDDDLNFAMDYNPEDISQINVAELLNHYNPNLQG